MVVSGVTGVVGRRLVPLLRADGATVVGLSRSAARAEGRVPELSEAIRWAGAGSPLEDGALDGAQAVVHLAGEPVAGRWTDAKKERIESSRVQGTARIVDAIERAKDGPSVLVSASAMGIYGDRGDDLLSEDEPAATDFLARVCAGWEREALRAESLGVRVVRLRIGLVLATQGGALAQLLPIFRGGIGGRIGSGAQYWSWIHLDDMCGVIREALRRDDMSGAYNVCVPTSVRQRDFAKVLGGVLGRPAVVPTPAFALKAALGGFAAEILGSRRLVPARLVEAGYQYRHPELQAALEDLLG